MAAIEVTPVASRTGPCDCGAQHVQVDVTFAVLHADEVHVLARVTGTECQVCESFEVTR